MPTKSENFHRLATKRVETILDAIRIFGNLHSQNYEWTSEEVLSYVEQIRKSVDQAVNCFSQQKRWVSDNALPEPEPGPEPEPPPPPPKHREYSITEIIREAENDRHVLAETILLQRRVIEGYKNGSIPLPK